MLCVDPFINRGGFQGHKLGGEYYIIDPVNLRSNELGGGWLVLAEKNAGHSGIIGTGLLGTSWTPKYGFPAWICSVRLHSVLPSNTPRRRRF